ncbi:hypothetical protein NUW58_g5990 [Xylaria curta]|uniref:Uncharacterized protein n=1 Tax=Xylaria curta TaxID=42375 RepID=A0ACC1P080_9PEZI|nr:hypothetical protein NUW58_g5990 [Xylaria curta]
MAGPIPDPVTIDRAYFETLVRRANYNNDGLGVLSFAGDDKTTVLVPKREYEGLLLLSRQFANLKTSLMGAGVTEENIAVGHFSRDLGHVDNCNQTLIQDATSPPQTDPYVVVTPPYSGNQSDGLGMDSKQAGCSAPTFRTTSYTTYSPAANNTPGNIPYFNAEHKLCTFEENHDWGGHERLGGTFTPSYSADGPADIHMDSLRLKSQPPYARTCKRTVLLCGLPAFTTLGDVTSVVRGGQLLDVFLRSAEHIASVSFVREDDAIQFYDNARKNDIYIKSKRIFIKWADRHFILPGHVANKVAAGATRNLIIRRCGAHHTEDSVRDDLEHIHNLIVVKVEFVGGSCYIKTNSVNNAMFARTCMMSRAKYKGSKIEWDVDECEQPFEMVQKTLTKSLPQRVPSIKTHVTNTRNRFDMLRVDDDDNNESDDKFDTSSEMPSTIDVTA